jgi:type VI secretion system secreted protein Hcp
MSTADMFLKMQGVTGEANDAGHKGEIEVVSWSWGIDGMYRGGYTGGFGDPTSKARFKDLLITKRIDKASVTLMNYVRNHKVVDQAVLTVRKAGTNPLEYFKVELGKVIVRSLDTQSTGAEVVETISLGFSSFAATYVPQSATGAMGGGAVTFSADVEQA